MGLSIRVSCLLAAQVRLMPTLLAVFLLPGDLKPLGYLKLITLLTSNSAPER